ncbi:MAG: NADH-quinone oxidoreductase subunit J [Thermoanaerobaculales bacterium]|nr:NADH-quinone oxidoreductase subunit J [Thermoanaerobaculales bacterium]
MTALIFLTAAAIAIIFAVVAVVHRSPIMNVLALVGMFLAIAMVFAIIGMDFLAAIQVIVYSGAILVLFLFAIMLLDLRRVEGIGEGGVFQLLLGCIAVIGLGGAVVFAAARLSPETGAWVTGAEYGTAYPIGRALTGSHLFAFEFVSVVLAAAIIAAVYLARRDR